MSRVQSSVNSNLGVLNPEAKNPGGLLSPVQSGDSLVALISVINEALHSLNYNYARFGAEKMTDGVKDFNCRLLNQVISLGEMDRRNINDLINSLLNAAQFLMGMLTTTSQSD
jgi:hypothetical protein